MKRILIFGFFLFAAAVSVLTANEAPADEPVPGAIRNNKFFIESVRLTNLAQEAYEEGDYDLSTSYSTQALEYAEKSDEYVALQLKIKEADDAIAAAEFRINWAASIKAATRYPKEYASAQDSIREAHRLRGLEDWDGAIDAAHQVINALTFVTEEPPPPPPPAKRPVVVQPPQPDKNALPAQYTVRPWAVSKDCFWNIAGRDWVYGDSTKWRKLYEANRSKLPKPDNPDLILPGMVMVIPPLKGEDREGAWEAGKTYTPIK